MSAKELEGVTGNVKQAREQALVGNYDDSKVYYVGAIQGVQKVIKQTHDPETKQKWQEVRCNSIRTNLGTPVVYFKL